MVSSLRFFGRPGEPGGVSPRILLRRGIGFQSVVAGLKDDRLEAYPTVRIPGLTPPGSPETFAERSSPLHVVSPSRSRYEIERTETVEHVWHSPP